MREFERGTGFGGDGWVRNARRREACEGEDAGGLVEAEAGSKLTGGGADDTAAKGWVQGAEAVDFDGKGGGCGKEVRSYLKRWDSLRWGTRTMEGEGGVGSATAADWRPGEDDLGEDAGEFDGPAGFFLSGEFC